MVSDFCVTLEISLISWNYKKEHVVSLSSVEPEYRTISKIAADFPWLVRLLSGLVFFVPGSVSNFCYNQPVIHIVKNPIFLDISRLIDILFESSLMMV